MADDSTTTTSTSTTQTSTQERTYTEADLQRILTDRLKNTQARVAELEGQAKAAQELQSKWETEAKTRATLESDLQQFRTLVRHGVTDESLRPYVSLAYEQARTATPDLTLDAYLQGPAREHPLLRHVWSGQSQGQSQSQSVAAGQSTSSSSSSTTTQSVSTGVVGTAATVTPSVPRTPAELDAYRKSPEFLKMTREEQRRDLAAKLQQAMASRGTRGV